MSYYDEQLQFLARQTAQWNRLCAERDSLLAQQSELERRVRELDRIRADEQADVDRLEGRSLAMFFYTIVGKGDEILSREKQEACAAAVKYDAAVKELEAVNIALERCQAALQPLRGCEERYRSLLAAKVEAVRASGSDEAGQILALESEILQLEHQKTEIQEAMTAGRRALRQAHAISDSLESADSFATWDIMGGGVITDIMKHSQLDDAQAQVEQLQLDLSRFRTELADVTIHADLQVRIDGFMRFADYFFDGLFSDWAVKDAINQSQSQVQQTVRQIGDVLEQLEAMCGSANRRQAEARRQIDELALRARL